MHPLLNVSKPLIRLFLGSITPLFLYSIVTLIPTTSSAHEVEISGDVAATFHIEPNHNPKAGEPSRAWFALTRKGGYIIPLSQCNCQLNVYALPRNEDAQPFIVPTLKAIDTEQYKGIPSADIVFPKAGSYELELSGTAKAEANFQPFEFTYTVTVGAGSNSTRSD